MGNIEIANKFFLTSGNGISACGKTETEKKLDSFDLALTDAGVAFFNFEPVSSIVPPRCPQVSAEEGKKILDMNRGAFVRAVIARISSKKQGYLAATIAVAFPENPDECGYIAENHGIFYSSDEIVNLRKATEEHALRMLTRKGIISNKIRSEMSFIESDGNGWATSLAMAIYIQPCFIAK